MDLLTVLTHELGHALGLTHADDLLDLDTLMDDTLAVGQRRLVSRAEVEAAASDADALSTARQRAWDRALASLADAESNRPERVRPFLSPGRDPAPFDDFFADLGQG